MRRRRDSLSSERVGFALECPRLGILNVAGFWNRLPPLLRCCRPSHVSGSKSPWRYLSLAEGEIAAAVCERLIPTDEYPGAAWAGAVTYIDLQLCGHFRKYRTICREGLSALDRLSREKHQQPFASLDSSLQTELLQAVEKGSAKQRQFFTTVLGFTMQSYYGDPRHGGNRDEVGYRMLGIPATPVRGRSQHDLRQVRPS